ncbi:HlyU family transcriptional regulator [Halomonas sp. 328]|uniref:HlyU family transcriptional regulator n=1 Tax=Halomonas sp. 328 TaxID=2776704 RepID=UPI0018A7AEE2|nr:HlyU family transcriptional regulator [Halomonas sp. 328]MBF8221762.1 hypothetical protein [Halomonas sp. 328]
MLKKLLSGLFGQGGAKATPEAEPVEYRGYRITPDCQEQGGQYRVSGWIRLPVEGGEVKEHRFERSDVVPGREACEQLMISKAQRFIDDIGEAMFEPR